MITDIQEVKSWKVNILLQELSKLKQSRLRDSSSQGLAQGHIAGLWQEVDSGLGLWPWTG